MEQSVIGRWLVGGDLQVLSGPYLMLEIFSFSVIESCKDVDCDDSYVWQ